MTGPLMPRRRVDHGGSDRCGSLHRGEVRVIGSESTECTHYRQAEKPTHPGTLCDLFPVDEDERMGVWAISIYDEDR